MSDLVEFLTSQEIMVVYLIAAILLLSCFITYIVKSNSRKYRMKNNTRELNKLVEEVKEKVPVQEEVITDEKPVLQAIEESPVKVDNNTIQEEASSVNELLDNTAELKVNNTSNIQTEFVVQNQDDLKEKSIEEVEKELEGESIKVDEPKIINNIESNDGLQYTSIEPSRDDAKKELERLKNELREQEKIEPEMENIALNNYEEEQEASAIISLDELVKKSKDMYEANEATQYDDSNAPISIQDLEKKVGEKATEYSETFDIGKVVPEKEVIEELEEEKEEVNNTNINTVTNVNTNTISNVSTNSYTGDKKFKSSPIISPVYGIEQDTNTTSPTDLELENTANYEKLDEEIKKTNEFLMTLRELQKKLD